MRNEGTRFLEASARKEPRGDEGVRVCVAHFFGFEVGNDNIAVAAVGPSISTAGLEGRMFLPLSATSSLANLSRLFYPHETAKVSTDSIPNWSPPPPGTVIVANRCAAPEELPAKGSFSAFSNRIPVRSKNGA